MSGLSICFHFLNSPNQVHLVILLLHSYIIYSIGWKNSVRHNLSLHDVFIREMPSKSKVSYWCMKDDGKVELPNIEDFVSYCVYNTVSYSHLSFQDRYGRKLNNPDGKNERRTCSAKKKSKDDTDKENIAPSDYQPLPSLHSRLRPNEDTDCVILQPIEGHYSQDSGVY